MDDDEFPQWQYMGGKRKNKWATYDPACNEHLEGAYQAGAIVVELTSDDWKYTVKLAGLDADELRERNRSRRQAFARSGKVTCERGDLKYRLVQAV